MGENLKQVWAEFSTLSYFKSSLSLDDVHVHIYEGAHPHLYLKTQPRFSPVSLSLSMTNLESLARDKYSGFLRNFANYEPKTFYNIDT